jgi:hypothetical protein
VLDGNAIEINREQIPQYDDCRVIATLNGETACFTSQQRNVFPSEILACFRMVLFDGMLSDECNWPFDRLQQLLLRSRLLKARVVENKRQ